MDLLTSTLPSTPECLAPFHCSSCALVQQKSFERFSQISFLINSVSYGSEISAVYCG